jgi:hypothetical protein
MQNKPNFKKSQMNVNPYNTKDYENKSDWTLGESKPNSNPISKKPKMNVSLYSQKDYENISRRGLKKNKPNSNPVLSSACPERSRMGRMGQFQTAGERTKEAKKKKRVSGTFLRLWVAGKIDFLDGCDILYLW